MRVHLLCHAEIAATAAAAFPADEALTERGKAAVAETSVPRFDSAWCSPAPQCVETAKLLGVTATQSEALRGCDYGAWRGSTLDHVVATDHEAVNRWLTDPAAAPHGGESLQQLIRRAGAWLDRVEGTRPVLAIADASFIRAAIVHAIGAKAQSYWRVDVAPLESVRLSGRRGRWSWQAAG
jgi:broad specificity phosphatase PhoE